MSPTKMNTARSRRPTARVNSRLDKSLIAYVAAAGAAGVGFLALAQPVEAKVVYTPVSNIPLGPIDLNNDGITDITFVSRAITYGFGEFVYPAAGNGFVVGTVGNIYGPVPLAWGARIGPKANFTGNEFFLAGEDGCHPYCSSTGAWINKREHYLGVKFSIGGQTHYGWVRVSVGKLTSGQWMWTSGYAYETVPDKPIIAGQTSGFATTGMAIPPEMLSPSTQPASLGVLARGADCLTLWRREEETVAT